MPDVFPKDILLRVGGRTLARHGVLAVAGARRGLVEVPITFTRADATTCATYIDRDGLVRKAAANVPRVEFVDLDGDGIRETPGILLEGTRTNLCLRSEEFDNGTWTGGGAPAGVTANSDVAPDGTTTADTLTDDDAGAFESKSQAFTVANDSLPHVFGIFVKKTSAATNTFAVNLNLSGGGTPIIGTPRLNTNSGVVAGGNDTKAISVGNYWLFTSKITNNSTGNTTLAVSVYPASATNSGSNPGSDDMAATGSAVVWGAQVEKAAFLSSYIKTTSAAVTRAADSFTVPFNFGPVDMAILTRMARPVHADASGVLGVHAGIFQLGTAGAGINGIFLSGARNFSGKSYPGSNDRAVAIPAGAALNVAWQFRNLTTAPQVALDVGSGLSAFSTANTPYAAFASQTLRPGFGIEGGSDGLYGVLTDLVIARGLFSLNEMLAIA